MATLLYRLGKTAYRRWPVVLVTWLVILTGVGTFAAVFSQPLNSSFSIPGVASIQAADLQQELFPDAQDVEAPSAAVVVAAPKGSTLAAAPYDDVVADLVDGLATMDHVAGTVVGPVEAADAMQQAEAGEPAQADSDQLEAMSPLSEDG